MTFVVQTAGVRIIRISTSDGHEVREAALMPSLHRGAP